MTVEARHINLFPSLIPLSNSKEMLNPTGMDAAMVGVARGGFYHASDSIFPPLKDCSTLTFNNDAVDISLTRKRRREATDNNTNTRESVSFLRDNFSEQMMQQQQFEIDRLIFPHMERVKTEMEEQSRRQSNRTIRAIEVKIRKKLFEKDEQIEKISKLNMTLQDRVKTLHLENQLWRDLAKSNEATANALRSNLEQLLIQVNNNSAGNADCNADDAESFCGSSGRDAEEEVENRAEILQWKTVGRMMPLEKKRMCRRCGERESGVLLLPCRHLCLCIACGPTVHICPICNGAKNASVHVNFS